MNRKPPAFMFYPSDWKSSLSVRLMTAEQRGWYIQLLCEAWDSSEPGFLPADVPVWFLAGAKDEETFKGTSRLVEEQFKKDNRGRLYNPRLLLERQRQIEWRERCSRGGKISSDRKKRHLQVKDTCVSLPSEPQLDPQVEINTSVCSFQSSVSDTNPLPPFPKSGRARKLNKEPSYSKEFINWFWSVYPKKDAKAEAFKAWQKIEFRNGDREHIRESVIEHCKTIKWQEDSGRYIPQASKFLNQRLWTDEIAPNQLSWEYQSGDAN